MLKSIDINTIHYHLWVLSGISVHYEAATSQILAIYEIFPGRMSGSFCVQHIEIKGKQLILNRTCGFLHHFPGRSDV